MPRSSRFVARASVRAIAALLTLTLTAACRDASDAPITVPVHAHGGEKLTVDQLRAIASVRNATARFHDIAVAQRAGYTNQYPAGCKSSPSGAQGFHWLNPALVDGTVNLLTPELVMYEPQADGSMQLIGVDYIVPFDQWNSPQPPQLLGVPFMRNEPLGVWALHIWAWRPNPSGAFAMWNPSASCANAQ
jgi:hypothetical protein